jgi:hypothetical protein
VDEGEGLGDTTPAKSQLDPWTLSFPARDSLRRGESGQGYALRMAEDNHLGGLPPLKGWLGKSRFATLDSVDAPLLRHWFGAHHSDLEHALGTTSTGCGANGYSYAGQPVGRSYFLNRTYPRVCAACLIEDGYCRLAWDFSLTVACGKHKARLVDRCPVCQQALSWNRPAINACSCGNYAAPVSPSEEPTAVELQFSAWVEARLISSVFPLSTAAEIPEAHQINDEPAALMLLLEPLTLNCGLQITYALGTAASYDVEMKVPASRMRSSLKKAARILSLANRLAEKIVRLEPVQFRISRPSAVIALLADSASARVSAADRSLARSILETILLTKSKIDWKGTHPQMSQLRMF